MTYRRRFIARFDGDEDGLKERSAAYQRLIRDLLGAQRQTLLRLRNEGKIDDEVMHRIEHDLDLEESRLEVTPTQISTGSSLIASSCTEMRVMRSYRYRCRLPY